MPVIVVGLLTNGCPMRGQSCEKIDANQTLSEASRALTSGNAANSVQNYSEALVLNLVFLVFFAAVLSATRVLSVADRMAQDTIMVSQRQANFQLVRDAAAAAAAGARMHRRIMATVGVCFVLFSVGVAIRFTFQMLVELVSSPLALCFALRGMTSDRDRKEMYGTQQVLLNNLL